VCQDVILRVESRGTPFTRGLTEGTRLRMPIAHGEGNWTADPQTLERMKANGQIVFRYVDEGGNQTPSANPNGSLEDVAGICNEDGNVLGLMPHPERAVEELLGSADGAALFRSFAESLMERVSP
jgi:phosphoribosylformylglycinamidine synthase